MLQKRCANCFGAPALLPVVSMAFCTWCLLCAYFLCLDTGPTMTMQCAVQVVKGIVEGCRQSDCALLGGEVCQS